MASDTTKRILLQIDLDADAVANGIVKTNDKIELLGKQLATANLELREMEDLGKTNTVAYSNLQKQIAGFNIELKTAKTEAAAYSKQAQLLTVANKGTGDSLAAMKAQLSLLTTQFDGLDKATRLSSDEGKALQATISQLTQDLKDEEEAMGNHRRSVGDYAKGFVSLREELKQARDQATALSREFGNNSAQSVAATEKVAELTKQYKNFNDRVAALNPEAKFTAVAQSAASIAGGLSAAQSALSFFGAESEDVQKALLKVQAAANFAQGLNQLAQLGDGLKNLRLAFTAGTAAANVNTGALVKQGVAAEAGAVQNTELAVSEQRAAAGAITMGTALTAMLGPFGLILLAATAVGAAFVLMQEDGANAIDLITNMTETETGAHEANIQAIKDTLALQTSSAENAIALAKAQGKSEQELFDLREKFRGSQRAALDQELSENKQHIDALLRRLEVATKAQQSGDLNDENTKKNNAELIKIDEDLHATRIRNQQIEQIEIKKLQTQQLQDSIEFTDKQEASARETSGLRISLLREGITKEIEAEKLARAEKLAPLLKDEVANAEKIQLIREASAQKIQQIEKEFAIKSVEEKNKVELAATIDGTEARIDAEIRAAIRERDVQVKGSVLTATQIRIIRAETNAKILDLEGKRLQLQNEIAKKEIDLEARKNSAIVNLNRTRATNPEERFASDLDAINQGTTQQLRLSEQAHTNELAENALFFKKQAEQLTFSLEFQKLSASEQKIAVNKIKKDEADEATKITEAAAIEQLNIQQSGVKATNDLIMNGATEKLRALIEFKQLEADAASEIEIQQRDFEKEILDAQQAQEILAVQQSIALEETKGKEITLIKQKYAKKLSDIDRDRFVANLSATSAFLAAGTALLRKDSLEQKAFSTGIALIDTYVSAQRAYKSQLTLDPTSPIRAALAAVTATIQGLARVQAIQGVQFYEGGYDEAPSGYTGDGNPRDVSPSHSSPRRTVHRKEYIIPARVLSMPNISAYVGNVVEPLRRGRYPVSSSSHFASGGFSEVPVVSSSGIGLAEMKQLIMDTVAAQPQQVLVIEQVNAKQQELVTVESRASF